MIPVGAENESKADSRTKNEAELKLSKDGHYREARAINGEQ